MADNYSYSFDYKSGVFRPSYVSAIGSFSVDYNSMRVYDINVVSGDIRFTSGTVEYGKISMELHHIESIYRILQVL